MKGAEFLCMKKYKHYLYLPPHNPVFSVRIHFPVSASSLEYSFDLAKLVILL
jgi:hypothetical protein